MKAITVAALEQWVPAIEQCHSDDFLNKSTHYSKDLSCALNILLSSYVPGTLYDPY